MFYSISRLANTKRDLSFQAMQKLYIACVISIADYGVSVWWKNQQYLLDKFNKLQNQVLRRILEAFRTFSIAVMKIEAGILLVSIKFKKLCKNYALKILQMQDNHLVKKRVSINSLFSIKNNEINLANLLAKFNNFQLAEWNQNITYLELEFEPEYSSQRRRKSRRIKQRKYSS